jgi:hypothetical protein
VLGVAEDTTGRARDIQGHLHSSFYYLISSIRADWPHGALNPGGLASDNYDTVRNNQLYIYNSDTQYIYIIINIYTIINIYR